MNTGLRRGGEPGYEPENEIWAYQKAKEWGERIPIGVIYRRPRPLLEEAHPALRPALWCARHPSAPWASSWRSFI